MSWTDERVELLKKMWGEGQSASQIAKELGGVTRNAVIGKVHRLGLSNRTAAQPAKPMKEKEKPEKATVNADATADQVVEPVPAEGREGTRALRLTNVYSGGDFAARLPLQGLDLARIESTRLDGTRNTQEFGGATIETMPREFTSDGAHLNERGRRHVAAGFVDALTRLTGTTGTP